ncbi:MAG: SusC/RagA family TonB-linked outer membrane protein [Bacteroidales bacterium]|nr:SusC/RagA family TonB-linked outer membrane protein [Bacteroidales bacterium]
MKKLTLLMAFLNAFAFTLLSQEVQVKGKVTSAEDGSALPGASVVVKGTSTATVTDPDGNYVIKLPAGANTLVVSFVGMKTQEVEVAGRTTVDIVMQPDVIGMEEVVVTALGISKERKTIGYAVQDVKSEDLTRVPNLNMINSLNGRVAGIQVTSASGVAGSSTYITIRGANSILGNNQPLFVVDGIPIDNSMNASGNPDNGSNNLLDGVAYSNRAIDLNPEDIESVTVLKGGAASALYGIRAANGVILITTKKGNAQSREGNIVVSSSVAFDEVNKLPELQNKFVQGQGGVYRGPQTRNRYSWGPKADTMYWDGSSNNPYDKNGFLVGASNPNAKIKFKPYDNLNTFFQTGITYNNSISFNGGNENSSFYANLTNVNTKGIVPNNTFDKTSLKITGETKITDKFSVDGSANYIKSGGNRIQQGSNLSGVMLGLLRTPISFDNSNGYSDPVNTPEAYMFPDGTPRSYRGQLPDGSAIYDNPYWTVNKNKFKDDVDRLIGYVGFRYKPLDWLNVTYKLGTDYTSDKRFGYFAKYSGANGAGQIQKDNHNTHIINSDLIFTISSKISDDISYNLVLGNNLYQEKYEQFYVEGNGIAQTDFYHMSNVSSYNVRQSIQKYRTAAFYANADISFMAFLNLTVTGREEWSTTLPKGNNAFFFPSASLSLIFTELEGLKNNPFLSFAKLRASIAKTANDAPAYYTKSTYSLANYGDGWTSGISFPFLGLTGYVWGNTAGNPNLKPEFTQSFETGVDFRLINSRIGLSATYFINKSTDLILSVPVAASSGYVEVAMNAASMQNKGIEITADVDIIKTLDLRWNLGVNYSKIDNEVLSLAEGVKNVFLGGFEGAQVRAVKGYPYGSLFGTIFVKDANGNVVIDSRPTVNGQPNKNYGYPMMSDKEEAFGTTLPDWTAGINTTISYKGFSLYALLDIRKGGVMWNGTRGALVSFGMAKETEDRGTETIFPGKLAKLENGDFVYDSKGNIVTEGDNNIKAVKAESWYNGLGGGFAGPSEQFTEKTDWVRLREVSLSYNLPQSMFKKGFVKGISITASGKNLWLSTPYKGIDPETNLMGAFNAQGIDYFNMPNTRTYVFGVKFTF